MYGRIIFKTLMFAAYNTYIYVIAMVLFFSGFQIAGLDVWVRRQIGEKINIYNRASLFRLGGRIARRVHIKAPRGVFFSSGECERSFRKEE